MTTEKDIQQLPVALQKAKGIKAETSVANIIASGYEREALLVGARHFFDREYTQDIVAASMIDNKWQSSLLQLQLSRPGFYDMLPEGLFFQPVSNTEYNTGIGVAEMAALYRQNKTKEKGIRNFFQPFEHAGFFQQLQLEEEERNLLQGLEKNLLHRHFCRFWDLPLSLSEQAIGIFIVLIPYAHRICGNLPLMQECLELLLEEKVTIHYTAPQLTPVSFATDNLLGQQLLGENMVCGDSFMEDYPAFKYEIGPLQQTKITDYLPGGIADLMIQTFNRFFLPVEASSEAEIEITSAINGMVLHPEEAPILGYSSQLTSNSFPADGTDYADNIDSIESARSAKSASNQLNS